MNFGIRRSVHFDDFDKWLLDLEGVPIELALPHDMEEFYPSIARLTDLADYVTEMVKHKHPFDRGLKARSGIEF